MSELKLTPLYTEHQKLNAKFGEFNQWSMPIQYTGIIAEHLNTRQNAGLFDICHMGEISISGPDAYEFVKGKPLTLMNGANLLYLLEKHGHQARINIKEARENMK